MPETPPPRSAARWTHAAAGTLVVAFGAWSLLVPAAGPIGARRALLAVTFLAVTVSAGARARRSGWPAEDRAMIVGLVGYALGWWLWLATSPDAAAGPASVVAWVVLFPGFVAALVVRAARAGIRPSRFALDALVGAVGPGAAVLGFVGPLVAGPQVGGLLPGGLPALYLAANVAMAMLTVTALAQVGARGLPDLWSRGGGALVMAGGSAVALQAGVGWMPLDGLATVLWVVGALLLATSVGWRPPVDRPVARRGSVLAMPLLGTVVALAVLLAGTGGVARAFAAGAVLLAVARLGLAFLDVDALAASRELALTDELTGLPNRRAFFEAAGEELAAGRPLTVVMLDLDGFKEVNDTLGHAAGDQLLVLVARRLAAEVRSSPERTEDRVARLGGDEFAVLLPGPGTEAMAAVERLLSVVAARYEVDGAPVTVSAAAGVVHAPEHGTDLGELLRRADVAMYAAKAARVPVVGYRPDLDTRSRDWLDRLERLRRALGDGGLELVFQPKVDLRTGEVSGVEALARLRVGGTLLAPGEFLAPLTRAGDLGVLTRQVLDLALAQARRWLDQGHVLPVAVNVSAEVLADGRLGTEVLDALARHDLPGDLLVVELTEQDLLADHASGAATFSGLRAAGVRVSVDDYGTGYSSLAYLRDLPIDEIKLDRTFVGGMVGDPRATRVVESTVALAHALGQRVVAEGVEDTASLEAVRDAGCDEVQGFLIARPMPAVELAAWLSRAGDRSEPVPAGPFRS